MDSSSAAEHDPSTAVEVPPPTGDAIYRHLRSYPFDMDEEYQAGLAAILGHPETPATPEELEERAELVLQTRCFYFARKFNHGPIDPVAYSAWVHAHGEPHHLPVAEPPHAPTVEETSSSTAQTSSAPPPTESSHSEPEPEPRYPTSFAAIVDLITRNIPIPGIEQIPDTVLEPGSSKVDKTPRRKKPWEKDAEENVDQPAEGPSIQGEQPDTTTEPVDVNGIKETGQGVVNILKPNAVSESNLLSKE